MIFDYFFYNFLVLAFDFLVSVFDFWFFFFGTWIDGKNLINGNVITGLFALQFVIMDLIRPSLLAPVAAVLIYQSMNELICTYNHQIPLLRG